MVSMRQNTRGLVNAERRTRLSWNMCFGLRLSLWLIVLRALSLRIPRCHRRAFWLGRRSRPPSARGLVVGGVDVVARWFPSALRPIDIRAVEWIGLLTTVGGVRRALPRVCEVVLSELAKRIRYWYMLGLRVWDRTRMGAWRITIRRVVAAAHWWLVARSRRRRHIGRCPVSPAALACSERSFGPLPSILRSGRRRGRRL